MTKQKTNYNSQKEQMGDKGYTMSDTSSVEKKSDYVGMSESNQKHTPSDKSPQDDLDAVKKANKETTVVRTFPVGDNAEQPKPLEDLMKNWVKPIDKETKDVKTALAEFLDDIKSKAFPNSLSNLSIDKKAEKHFGKSLVMPKECEEK